MSVLATIVEGHAEVDSLPVLIRRYIAIRNPPVQITIPRPIRISRSRLVKAGEIERAIQLAKYQAQDSVPFVLVDADDDCPARLGPLMVARARTIDPRAAVVVAKAEFEAWFLAGIASLRGSHGLRADLTPPANLEDIRDAKGWLSDHMTATQSAYSPTLDQAALASGFDFEGARVLSPSFDKCLRELDRVFDVLRHT